MKSKFWSLFLIGLIAVPLTIWAGPEEGGPEEGGPEEGHGYKSEEAFRHALLQRMQQNPANLHLMETKGELKLMQQHLDLATFRLKVRNQNCSLNCPQQEVHVRGVTDVHGEVPTSCPNAGAICASFGFDDDQVDPTKYRLTREMNSYVRIAMIHRAIKSVEEYRGALLEQTMCNARCSSAAGHRRGGGNGDTSGATEGGRNNTGTTVGGQ